MRRLIKIIRNLLLLVLAAIVALTAILLFNVFSHGSRQIEVAAVPRAPVDPGAAVRLSEAIRFQTISNFLNPEQGAEALRGLRAHIEKSFPAFHAAAKRELIGGHSLLYTWQGSDPRAAPIALLAHQDVVPVAPGTEKDWRQPPFDGVIADGFIWGRGSWDDKGNLYAMLEAAEQMAKQGFAPKRTVYFAFGHDEEVAGTRGAKAIAATLASRGVKLDFLLDEGLLITEGIMKGLDKPAALIGVVSEMFDTLAPEMSGFNRVVLSNLWLFKPLLLREFEKTGPTEAMVRTTTALTIFNAGDKDNVLPGNAAATVNFRLIPGDTEGSVIDHVRATVGNERIAVEPFPGNTDPPPVTGTAGPSFRMLNRTIREIFPDVIVAPGLMVAATDSRHFTGVTDTIFRFSPVRATSEDLKRFHGTNERISVEGYADMIRFYRRLIENSAG